MFTSLPVPDDSSDGETDNQLTTSYNHVSSSTGSRYCLLDAGPLLLYGVPCVWCFCLCRIYRFIRVSPLLPSLSYVCISFYVICVIESLDMQRRFLFFRKKISRQLKFKFTLFFFISSENLEFYKILLYNDFK